MLTAAASAEDSEITGSSQRIVRRKMGSVVNSNGNPSFTMKMRRSHIHKGALVSS